MYVIGNSQYDCGIDNREIDTDTLNLTFFPDAATVFSLELMVFEIIDRIMLGVDMKLIKK